MFKNVVLGWLGRRALEIGGLLGTLFAMYTALAPRQQDLVNQIFTGKWQDITLGALVPFAVYIGSQVLSFRATVQPQVVDNGVKVKLPELDPSTRAKVKVDMASKKIEAKQAPRFNPLDWFIRRG